MLSYGQYLIADGNKLRNKNDFDPDCRPLRKPITSSLATISALRPTRPEFAFARRSRPW